MGGEYQVTHVMFVVHHHKDVDAQKDVEASEKEDRKERKGRKKDKKGTTEGIGTSLVEILDVKKKQVGKKEKWEDEGRECGCCMTVSF